MYMEEIKEPIESKVRTKISQIANGNLRYEVTTRADTVQEALNLMKEAKKELELLCQQPSDK